MCTKYRFIHRILNVLKISKHVQLIYYLGYALFTFTTESQFDLTHETKLQYRDNI